MLTPKTDASSSRLTSAIAMLSLAVASQSHAVPGITPETTLYVDQRAPHGGNGKTWQSAFSDLQDALNAAALYPTYGFSWDERLIEIRVAQGTYKPQGPNGDRNRCFDPGLMNSAPVLSLRGSFAGLGSSDPDKQDFVSTVTMLSGDLNGDDGPNWTNRADNSRTILRSGFNLYGFMEIEGIEFSGASNFEPDSPGLLYGGALRIYVINILSSTSGSSVSLRHCRFLDNQTQSSNGAGLVLQSDYYTIEDCTFKRNRTLTGKGGGAWIESEGTSGDGIITRSNFWDNSAKHGGALFLRSGASILAGDFRNNSASAFGGAVYSAGNLNLGSVLLAKNSAQMAGGAIFSANSNVLSANMTTFASNSAPQGAAIDSILGPLNMDISIVWDSRFDQGASAINLGYGIFDSWISGTILQGGEASIACKPGTLYLFESTIDADPLFIRPASPEATSPELWNYRLRVGSPAIELSANSNGAVQDLDGAYRFCRNLSNSPRFDAGCYFFDSCVCWANLNADWDRIVNDEDFILFAEAYNLMIAPPALPRADLNHDGLVDDADFSLFAIAYDAFLCPSPN